MDNYKSKIRIYFVYMFTFVFFRFLFPVFWPSVVLEYSTLRHRGWDGSKDILKQRYAASVKDIGMEKDIEERYLNCVTAKTIDYLNNTTCKYLYNKKLTSGVEHIQEQDKCLKDIGFAQEEAKIDKTCTDEILASLK